MSLVGQLFTRLTGIPLSADRALLDTLCVAGVADGKSSAIEEGYALEIALDLVAFRRFSRAELEAALEEARAAAVADGSLTRSIARLSGKLQGDELREQAYTLAAVIVAVDQQVKDCEHGFLADFARALSLGEAKTRSIWREIEAELATIRDGNAPAPGS